MLGTCNTRRHATRGWLVCVSAFERESRHSWATSVGAKVRVAVVVIGDAILGAVQGDKEDQDHQRGHAGERDHDVLVVRHRSGVVLGGLELLQQHNHQTVDGLVEEALSVEEKRS